jgi:hypothetical protein
MMAEVDRIDANLADEMGTIWQRRGGQNIQVSLEIAAS